MSSNIVFEKTDTTPETIKIDLEFDTANPITAEEHCRCYFAAINALFEELSGVDDDRWKDNKPMLKVEEIRTRRPHITARLER